MWRDPIKFALNNNVVKEAVKEKIRVEEAFRKLRRAPRKKDYSQVCSVTTDYIFPKLFTDFSGRLRPDTVAPVILDLFRNLLNGDIGTTSPVTNSKNPIGRCAEQHAANILMKKAPVHAVPDIQFSICVRSRTLEWLPYCQNCRILFPQLS